MMSVDNDYASEKLNLNGKVQPIIEATGKRWIILTLYILYSTVGTMQWVQYSIITNIVMKYYNVSASAVDWTSMTFMIVWPTLVFPTSFIIDKMGLRVAGLFGACGTAIGAAIKVLSIGQDLFYVVLIGQAVVAISQTFVLSLPPKIATTWFRSNEISTVCSLGIIGMTLGSALGFLLPPMIVKNHANIDDIGNDLKIMCWATAIAAAPLAIMVVLYFPREPANPPSQAMCDERTNRNTVTVSLFLGSIKKLFKNKAFLVHALSYGCNVGVYSAIATLLNQFVLYYFEGAEEDAGRMGLVMIVVGIAGAILTGVVLDKTHRFKETAVVIFILCAVSMCGFLFALEMRSKWMVYLAISIFGFFLNAYLPAGIEFASEITYPSQESTVAGLLLAVSQIMGVCFTMALGEVNARCGSFWAILAQAMLLGVGTVMTLLTPNVLNRQAAFNRDVEFQKVAPVSKSAST